MAVSVPSSKEELQANRSIGGIELMIRLCVVTRSDAMRCGKGRQRIIGGPLLSPRCELSRQGGVEGEEREHERSRRMRGSKLARYLQGKREN